VPQAKRYVDAYMKKFNRPPDSYSGYGYSGIMEVARGVELAKSTDSNAVANALRKNKDYDHYKGKQWWRACDNKSFQDLWITKVRSPQQVKGEWGYFDIVAKVAANEELDRTCAEKGFA
jgi:branched-chain amino acid transport system substrate-binding protein